MKKNKVVIHLMGRDYTLLTNEDAAQVQRLARYVDRRMREVSITTRAGENVVPTLTAMTLADELFRAQDENVRLKKELAALQPKDKA
ncbi:MAG: cell division protein ZapA [Candidatus Ventricola sp.]